MFEEESWVHDIASGLFTSWQFAREFTDCPVEELRTRSEKILTTLPTLSVIAVQSEVGHTTQWVSYLRVFDSIDIPIKCLNEKCRLAISKCITARVWASRHVRRNLDQCTMSSFAYNTLVATHYYDAEACFNACYTYGVAQLEALNMSRENAEEAMRNSMHVNADEIVERTWSGPQRKLDVSRLYNIVTKNSEIAGGGGDDDNNNFTILWEEAARPALTSLRLSEISSSCRETVSAGHDINSSFGVRNSNGGGDITLWE